MRTLLRSVIAITPLALTLGSTASAGSKLQVIYSEIVGSPTADVPGALDSAGLPVVTQFIALEDINISPDGSAWIVKGRTAQGSTNDSILILGGGTIGTMFAQDDQPFVGASPGELYDFFDTGTPVVWDDNGNFAFSARAKNGVSSIKEKLIRFDGVNHTLILTESTPATGLLDIPTNPTGDELIGNSIGSVYLMNNGSIGFVNTPIQNCSSFRYPAFFIDANSFMQSGVSPIGGVGELWDNFSLSGAGGTPDGLHWYAIGDTDAATTVDEILAVDGVVVVREGSPVAGSTMIADDTFDCRMTSDGTWFARGDDPNADDWAMINGTLIVKTGDPLNGTENYGNSFACFTGNRNGDWILIANTTSTNPNADQVMVLNGIEVCREGDPIDLDGNGLFDDNTFVNSFQANDARLTDDGVIYFLATTRDGSGTTLGDIFIRSTLCGAVDTYGMGCPGSGGFVPTLDLTGCSRSEQNVTLEITNALGPSSGLLFLGLTPSSVPVGGSCLLLLQPLPSVINLPLAGSGPGTGSLSLPATIPSITAAATFQMQLFVIDPGVSIGFSSSAGLQVTLEQ